MTTWEPAAIPQVTRVEILLDADRDGTADYRIRDGASGDTMSTRYARWNDVDEAWGDEVITGTTHTADLHSNVRMLGVPLDAIELGEDGGFGFHVIHRGLNEDWLFTPNTDVAPDGALEDGGPRYSFEPLSIEDELVEWTADIAGGELYTQTLSEAAAAMDWLAVYPSDPFGDEAGPAPDHNHARTEHTQPGLPAALVHGIHHAKRWLVGLV